MRVLLIYANPHLRLPVSPYGLEILRAHLTAQSPEAEVRIVNPFIESLDPEGCLADALVDFDPELVGLSVRNLDNSVTVISPDEPPDGRDIDIDFYARDIRRLCDVVKQWNADVPCVVGGAFFNSSPAELLDYLDLDYGLIGAAEDSFRRLAESRPADAATFARGFAALPGAVCRVAPGCFVSTPARTDVLHGEPGVTPAIAPEYQLLYRLHGIPAAVRTKTGCPLRCRYCIDPVNMRRTDTRPIEHVLDDIESYVYGYGITSFHIADAELNLPYEEHLLALCAGLRDRGLHRKITWRGYFNATPCSDRLLDALADTGCRAPSFAIDSFHAAGLRSHGKNFRLPVVHDLVRRLVDRDMRPEICLLLGQPGETSETLAESIDWMLRYADQGCMIAYSCGQRVYPNTPLAKSPLPPAHLYRLPGPAAGVLDPVVHCEPYRPRALAAVVHKRVAGHPNVGQFVEPFAEARFTPALRAFNVGVHRLARGRLDDAIVLFEGAIAATPELRVARIARDLARAELESRFISEDNSRQTSAL